jgi:hypothetical protein
MHPGIDVERFTLRSDPELWRKHSIPLDAPLVSIVGAVATVEGTG